MKQDIQLTSPSDAEKNALAQDLAEREAVENSGGCCGGGCCGSQNSGRQGTPAKIFVEGMTCGHCAETVIETLEEFDEILDIEVELKPGEKSVVTFWFDGDISPVAIRDALADAGYRVVAAD